MPRRSGHAVLSRRALLGGAIALAGAHPLRAVDDVAATVLTASDVHPANYPTVEAVRWIGERLREETDGRVQIRIYPSGQLGREGDAINLARFGALDLVRVYTGALNNAFPLTLPLGLPYLFDSVAHLRRALDGAAGERVLGGFESRGLVGLAIYDSGARCIYNTRGPIRTPDDLAGLKLRVPPSDAFMALLRALQANPTPLAYGEVFSALETGLVDGAENNIRSFHASRHFERARFWSQTEHSFAPDVLLMSKSRFDVLSAADQERLRALARASVGVMRGLWDSSEAQARAALVDVGVAFNDVDRDAFRAVLSPLVQRWTTDRAVRDVVELIREAA